jgi:hypothetical protein
MVFGVATQGGASTGQSGSPFFPLNPVTTAASGALTVNKPALGSRVRDYVSPCEEDGLIARIIEAIRRFFVRICRVLLAGSPSANNFSDNSLQKPATTLASREDEARVESGTFPSIPSNPSIAETDDELSLHGLSEPTLERVQETVDCLIRSVEGSGLSHSVRTALSMPEGDQRTTFRVLLQHNLSDTLKMRGEAKVLETDIEALISPYATEHGITATQAAALLRADLKSGGHFIANRLDRNCEIRGRVAQLERLNSSLAGLAKARGEICSGAIESGSYTREELGALIAQHGFDTAFLFLQEPIGAAESVGDEKANVISLSDYKDNSLNYGVAAAPGQDLKVKDALRELAKGDVTHADAETEAKLIQAAVVDDVLSDEAEFETDMQGDDFGDFLSNRGASKTKPGL